MRRMEGRKSGKRGRRKEEVRGGVRKRKEEEKGREGGR